MCRLVLENAIEHKGKAEVDSVVRRLAAELPELRPKLKEVLPLVREIVSEVNALSHEEQIGRLREYGPLERPKRMRREGLPELPEVEKYEQIVTRFAPNPNGPLHLGHVRAALLSYEYARMYGGKFILRFEDTNPVNARLDMYELIKEDLRWLGIEWDEEFVQSDRMELYYRIAERLLEGGKAYVCTCEVENFRGLRDKGEPCPCRELRVEEHMVRWRRMVGGKYEEGEAVMRLKTDLRHPNPAVRDWPAFRVVKSPHPRVGMRYNAWPLYNFSVSVDDHEMGITHIIRGKEHEVNELRQRALFKYLGWRYPTVVQYGRLTLAGMKLSKTEIVNSVRRGELSGYDDVRLGTLSALRRRGFLPQAIRRVIMEVGLTTVDASVSWEGLAAFNRKLVDDIANRYFFVPGGVELSILKAPEISEVEVPLHPSHPERGKRRIPLRAEEGKLLVRISRVDLDSLEEGKTFRLKDFMNVVLKSKSPPEAEFHSMSLMPNVPKIQWVPERGVEVDVLKPDGSVEKGVAEPGVAGLIPGELVQFERYGFVKIEKVGERVSAVFTHK